MTARRRGLAVVALILAVAGCAPGTQSRSGSDDGAFTPRYLDSDEYTAGRAQQEQLLADGSLTKPEYELAAQRFVHCLAAHGLEVSEDGWDLVNGQQLQIYYGSTTKSQQDIDGYGDECLAAHFAAASEAYSASVPPVMAPGLMESVRHCLTSQGIAISGQETSLPALRESAPKKDKEVTDCVVAGVKQIRPDRPVAIGG